MLGGRGLRLAAAAGPSAGRTGREVGSWVMLAVGDQAGARPRGWGGAARHRWPAAAGSGRRRLGGGRVWDGSERRRPLLPGFTSHIAATAAGICSMVVGTLRA